MYSYYSSLFGVLYFNKMKFLEKDLESIVYETDNHLLRERGLWIFGKKLRQVRIGNYGIADMVSYTREIESSKNTDTTHILSITIFEFKKDEVNMNTLLQCVRYAKGIERYFLVTNRFENCHIKFNFVLCGKNIASNDDWVYFTDYIENLKLFTYDYGFDGIRFKTYKGWYLINEGFKTNDDLPF